MQREMTTGNPNLYLESIAAKQLVDEMREQGFDGEDIGISVESETSFTEAVSAAVRRLDELEELAAAAKAMAARYTERRAVLELRHEQLRDVLAEALERSSAPMPLRLLEGTVSLKDTPPSAIVTSEAQLPDDYWVTSFTRRADLRAVARDLREGREVPGACLKNSRRSVAIRRA